MASRYNDSRHPCTLPSMTWTLLTLLAGCGGGGVAPDAERADRDILEPTPRPPLPGDVFGFRFSWSLGESQSACEARGLQFSVTTPSEREVHGHCEGVAYSGYEGRATIAYCDSEDRDPCSIAFGAYVPEDQVATFFADQFRRLRVEFRTPEDSSIGSRPCVGRAARDGDWSAVSSGECTVAFTWHTADAGIVWLSVARSHDGRLLLVLTYDDHARRLQASSRDRDP